MKWEREREKGRRCQHSVDEKHLNTTQHQFAIFVRVKNSVIIRISHVSKNILWTLYCFIDRFPFLRVSVLTLYPFHRLSRLDILHQGGKNILPSFLDLNYVILPSFLPSFLPLFCRESVHHLMAQGMTPAQFLSRCSFFSLMWMLTNYLLVYTLRTLDVTVVMSLFACTVTLVYLLSWVVLHHQFVGIRVSTTTVHNPCTPYHLIYTCIHNSPAVRRFPFYA